MSLRLPEPFTQHRLNAYGLARKSGGRISLSTIYRITKRKGRVELFDADLLDALCGMLDVAPAELLERETKRRGRAA